MGVPSGLKFHIDLLQSFINLFEILAYTELRVHLLWRADSYSIVV